MGDIDDRVSRMERIVKMLLLLETVKTRSIKQRIHADLRTESLAYLYGKESAEGHKGEGA